MLRDFLPQVSCDSACCLGWLGVYCRTWHCCLGYMALSKTVRWCWSEVPRRQYFPEGSMRTQQDLLDEGEEHEEDIQRHHRPKVMFMIVPSSSHRQCCRRGRALRAHTGRNAKNT